MFFEFFCRGWSLDTPYAMQILFEQKKPGRKSAGIEPVAIELDCCPSTVGELIASTVRSLVSAFNGRAAMATADMDALQSYDDGLFRIFINGIDAGEAANPVRLSDSDLVTVVRLTLLSGRMW